MQPRLLIINCPSAYFVHVPMGTFGLCDYLSQKKIPARMLNLALYDKTQMATVLNRYLKQFRPTHVGLTFHWQETKEDKPLFEISPEVFDNRSRQKIKRHMKTYSIQELKENLGLINDCLGNGVKDPTT